MHNALFIDGKKSNVYDMVSDDFHDIQSEILLKIRFAKREKKIF